MRENRIYKYCKELNLQPGISEIDDRVRGYCGKIYSIDRVAI